MPPAAPDASMRGPRRSATRINAPPTDDMNCLVRAHPLSPASCANRSFARDGSGRIDRGQARRDAVVVCEASAAVQSMDRRAILRERSGDADRGAGIDRHAAVSRSVPRRRTIHRSRAAHRPTGCRSH
jgi:hypothetical protein